jgi:hypothetical protein
MMLMVRVVCPTEATVLSRRQHQRCGGGRRTASAKQLQIEHLTLSAAKNVKDQECH